MFKVRIERFWNAKESRKWGSVDKVEMRYRTNCYLLDADGGWWGTCMEPTLASAFFCSYRAGYRAQGGLLLKHCPKCNLADKFTSAKVAISEAWMTNIILWKTILLQNKQKSQTFYLLWNLAGFQNLSHYRVCLQSVDWRCFLKQLYNSPYSC